MLADFDRSLPRHRAASWGAALKPVMAWLRTRAAYDARLRALGAADPRPAGVHPLPVDDAAHPYGTPGFMGLPRKLCALQGRALAERTEQGEGEAPSTVRIIACSPEQG